MPGSIRLSPKLQRMLNLILKIGDGVISPEAYLNETAEEGDSLQAMYQNVLYINDELKRTNQTFRIGYIKKTQDMYENGSLFTGSNGGYTLFSAEDERKDVNVSYFKFRK